MRTIRHHVDSRAAEQPLSTYLIAPETGAVMTYAELRRASQRLTRFLLGRGLVKGDKVALMLHNGYQTARLLIGVMYGGRPRRPHLIDRHGHTQRGRLPGGLAAGQPAADDVDH